MRKLWGKMRNKCVYTFNIKIFFRNIIWGLPNTCVRKSKVIKKLVVRRNFKFLMYYQLNGEKWLPFNMTYLWAISCICNCPVWFSWNPGAIYPYVETVNHRLIWREIFGVIVKLHGLTPYLKRKYRTKFWIARKWQDLYSFSYSIHIE